MLNRPALMTLNGTTESLTIVMSGAAGSINPTYLVKQVDGNGAPLDAVGTLNGVTAVVPLTGEAGPPKVIESLLICNSDTAPVTVTVNKKVGSTSYPIAKAIVLPVGSTLSMDGSGNRVYDVNGALAATTARLAVQSIAAAGSLISDATALIEGFNVVSGADGTKGVILPVAAPGMRVYLKGTTNAVLKVWPQTGAAINAVAASSAMSLASGLIPAIFVASSSSQWYTIPLLPS